MMKIFKNKFWRFGGLLITLFVFSSSLALLLRSNLAAPVRSGPLSGFVPEIGHAFSVSVPRPDGWMRQFCRFPSDPQGSTLLLFEDGRPLRLAHSLHDAIRVTGEGRYSHWGDVLYLSTSDNSDPRANGRMYTVEASPRPAGWLWLVCAVSGLPLVVRPSTLLTLARRLPVVPTLIREHTAWVRAQTMGTGGVRPRAARRRPKLGRMLRNTVGRVDLLARVLRRNKDFGSRCALWLSLALLAVPSLTAIAAAIFYLATSLVAAAHGEILAPAAAFRLFPSMAAATAVAENIPFLPHFMLGFATLGTIWAWLADAPGTPLHRARRPVEVFLARLWRFWGLPCVAALFLLELGRNWAGLGLQGGALTLSGLLPFSDSFAYWHDAWRTAQGEQWTTVGSQRPLATVFRCLTLLVGGSLPGLLVFQAVLLSLAAWLATLAVACWRGTFAGLAFLGMASIMARAFIPSLMTESMALIIAFLGFSLLLTGLRRRSFSWLCGGFVGMCLALLIRMGALFTLPAMWAWLGWLYRGKRRAQVRALLLAGLALAPVLVTQYGLKQHYGQSDFKIGGNFAYSICGMTLGGNWGDARDKYQHELSTRPAPAQIDFLYQKAWENIKANPTIFINAVWKRFFFFLSNVGIKLLVGYDSIPFPYPLAILMGPLLPLGWVFVLTRRRLAGELALYIMVGGGLCLSVPFVIYDDGWRVLMATYPFLWLLTANGFTAPSALGRGMAVPSRTPGAASAVFLLGAIFLSSLVAPLLLQWNTPAAPQGSINSLEYRVRGDQSLAGILVLPDGVPLPRGEAAMHESAFYASLKQQWLVDYWPKGTASKPTAPFALVAFVPVPGVPARAGAFIAPPTLLLRRENSWWDISIDISSDMISLVRKMSPVGTAESPLP